MHLEKRERIALFADHWLTSLLCETMHSDDQDVVTDFGCYEDLLRRTEGVEIKCNDINRFLALARRWPYAVMMATEQMAKLEGKLKPNSTAWVIITDSEDGWEQQVDVVVKQ